jgi:hypothetical protein
MDPSHYCNVYHALSPSHLLQLQRHVLLFHNDPSMFFTTIIRLTGIRNVPRPFNDPLIIKWAAVIRQMTDDQLQQVVLSSFLSSVVQQSIKLHPSNHQDEEQVEWWWLSWLSSSALHELIRQIQKSLL